MALLEKNLLKQEYVEQSAEVAASQPRFAMLETVREYALERLKQSGQEPELHKRHAVYYTELTEIAVANLDGTASQMDLRQLELELDNLRAALNWCRETGDKQLHYRALSNLWRFWRFWGLISEGRSYLENGLTEIIPAGPGTYDASSDSWVSNYVEALYGAGILAIRQYDYPKAAAHLQQGLTLATQVQDIEATAKFLCAIGELNRRQARYEPASTYYQQSLELYKKLEDKAGIALVYHNLGSLASLQNDLPLAHYYLEEALTVWEEQNNNLGITGTSNLLAEVSLTEGNYQAARLYCERSLALKLQLGDKTGKARLFIILGYICLKEENWQEAATLFWNSLELLRMVGDKGDIARCLNGLGFLFLAQGEREQAETFFLESLQLKQKESRLGNLIGLAILLKERGETVKAIQLTGTIQKLVETEESKLMEFYRHHYERILATLHAACDLQDFEIAWQQGYDLVEVAANITEVCYQECI